MASKPVNFSDPESEFKEFEPQLKFKPPLKYGWFHLKLYSIFQDLSRHLIKPVFVGFETRLNFIKSDTGYDHNRRPKMS